LTVIRRAGSASPEAISAERIRSRALGDRLVGQSDDGESRQAGRDLHLHVDGAGFDPLKSYGGNTLDHAALPGQTVA
jgi:hypothetical protein